MNFNELDNSATDSDSDRSVGQEAQQTHLRRSSQEAPSLPSVPLDPEWVSPFTLPPLPALRKNRGQSRLLRSPEERLHQRSSSSAYYAAAWGSPYATPSPNRSPHTRHIRRRSQEPDTTSPLSSRTQEHHAENTQSRNTTKSQDLSSSRLSNKRRANSWDKSTSLSERFNWLSESDLSGGEVDKNAAKTPTRDTYLRSLKSSTDKRNHSKLYSHQVQDSVATITPETFNASSVENISRNEKTETSPPVMEQPVNAEIEARELGNSFEKPLPSLPLSSNGDTKAGQMPSTDSPDSPSRPRMSSMQSFQRPKRKVQWKGKTCIIALPLTDRESAGLPPLLSSDEIKMRMQKWAAEGYDIDNLSIGGPQDVSAAFGQSSGLFPDPQDMYAERKLGQLHVHIPDQAEWDAWVDYLKEEKLRALGVTPSNSEAPMSVQSPFSSTLSRVSSTYPSLAASPPLSTISANGNSIRVASNTFSPPLGHQGNMSSHTGSHVASPSISGFNGSFHGYKQSIAHPRMTSPYDYPVSHPGLFSAGMRNNSGAHGARQFSPPTALNLQSLGQVLTPMVPIVPSNDNGRGMPQHPTMEQIRQQQQRQQQLHQHMVQHQRQFSYIPPPQSKSADQLPRTPILESPSRKTPEIMHPTPRSHRHNLSAALQKGVDDAEALRTDRASATANDETQEPSTETEEGDQTGLGAENEQEPELPVLKRPEHVLDNDDKSEIETNPSIAASPMLMNDENPFATPFSNLRHIKDALQSQSQSQHKPAPSMSKLNVEAPEFNPQARFSSANFSFGGQSFQPVAGAPDKPLMGGARPPFTQKNLSLSGLNADAPAFTPSFMAQSTPGKSSIFSADTPAKQSIATPSKSSFTFSSPSFNVDAPEFKPGQSFSFAAGDGPQIAKSPPPLTSAGNIFGNVTVDANSKVNRRGTKVLPITRPKSSEGTSDEQDVDDEGRIKAPSDRHKRARRVDGEDDDELLFASSAPFSHKDGLTFYNDEHATHSERQTTLGVEAVNNEPNDHIEFDTALQSTQTEEPILSTMTEPEEEPVVERPSDSEIVPQNNSAEAPLIEDSAIRSESDNEKVQDADVSINISPADFPNQKASTDDNEVGATASEVQLALKSVEESHTEQPQLDDSNFDNNILSKDQQESSLDTPSNTHKTNSSLSALAKPFEFRLGAASSFVPQTTSPVQKSTEVKKNRGLLASRFANISPPPEKQVSVTSTDSPQAELYEYIRPEDAGIDMSEILRRHDGKMTPKLELPNMHLDATPELVKSIEESMRSEAQIRPTSPSLSQSSRVDEQMPSYEEIDAVMKQFENNPELGVERDDTPVKSTPSVDMRLAPVFRSDAPSPSPKRTTRSPQRRADWGLGIHRLNEGNEEVSDWNNEFSPRQIDKLQSQAQHFDNRLNSLVEGMLDNRLRPFEQTLHAIQESLLSLVDKSSQSNGQRSLSSEKREESDADDEDESDALDRLSAYRSRSPSRNQRKAEKVRAMVIDTLAAQNVRGSERTAAEMSAIHATLDEIKQLSQQNQQVSVQDQSDIRAVIEDVISNHASFKTLKKQDDYEAIQETHKLKIEVLESSLREAEKRAEAETALRQQADDDIKELNQKLIEAQKQAALYREASEEAQSNISVLRKEQEAHEELRSQYTDVLESNRALEDTLAEYRVTSDQFREDIKLERARNEDLIRRLRNLREDFNEKLESRQALRNQLERLQDRMTQVMDDVHAEESEWRTKEQDLVIQNKTIQAALDHETRHRQRLEAEHETLLGERKENVRVRALHEHSQQEMSRLQEQITVLNDEKKALSEKNFTIERELTYARESASDDLTQATVRLQSELEAARATIESLQTDSNAQISRLQKRLDDAELDLEDQKAKHDVAMSDAAETHNQALHEANQKREGALEELHSSHERRMNDLRERHTRALHNSSDDRHRLEYHLNEKLAISEERTKHMEGQIKDLEERLEITKSAARAAVEAATAKTASIPTPASSVMASPPQRTSSASVQIAKGTGLPEKISPQAMRESIMVLQEQLQKREQMIEQLETELAAVDKDAPLKLKERDNEIALLRELLSVRLDDLNEIIATLSQSSFDREAAKNAAIRLKANLQMEQQLKERAASIGGLASSLPSLSTISNLAPSPRGLPMAAAAAWGNWRKARDFSLNAVSDIAANISQTPSKSTAGSPSSLLAGIMTPPSTSQRTPPPTDTNPLSPPTMRPLAAAAAAARKNGGVASEARPLRPFSTQARTLSSRQAEKRRESNESTSPSSDTSKHQPQPWPETPTTSRNFKPLDLGDDIDEDASPLSPRDHENTEAQTTAEETVMA